MEKISVAIITKDEEANIRACLESVKWADEIVVVDSGSTDRTEMICQDFQARFFLEEWKGFPRQKNSAIEKTGNEWVLSLDADERVSPELRQEIQQSLDKNPTFDGYFIARKNFFLGRWIRHCGWYPDFNLRLFRKSLGRFQEREVHEKVEIQGKVGFLEHPLEHRTYSSLSDFLERMNRYSTLAAREMLRQGKRYCWFDAFFRPPFTFLQMYLLRAGFLEGYLGFLLAGLYSFYTFAKYSKLRELQSHEGSGF
ncbi:MAG: glycosyltransferase family 2 protein [Deltaproteobacteria bacterium]|nr:glycosyltransferase family 2 protein [Deltaproteobacteria bacterium]